ncbi:hypothetical protein [Mycoplasma simbae]|uniref:hypothetical protein n=1 Tax=Mycoplasma simbae TaxID=36744 RepID=UPI000689CCF5|nr:hypothetical protein [Mycoplasma simbae]
MNNKTKLIVKKVALAAGVIGVAGAAAAALTYKFNKPFKPTFYNYKSYMSELAIDTVSQNYDYKEFETINEFTKAILTRKALAGIGSDAQAVQLIRRGQLKEIDYLKLFVEQTPEWAQGKKYEEYRNLPQYRELQKNLYTDLVWNHLTSYDKVLQTDYNNKPWEDGQARHLYDYFIPYFTQDMVVAYNPVKVEKSLEGVDFSTEEGRAKLYQADQKVLNRLFNDGFNKDKIATEKEARLVDILRALKNSGYTRWEMTDAVRDNMIYGSAYEYDNESTYDDSFITGNANTAEEPDLYKRLIDNFSKLIEDGIGAGLTDPSVQLLGDGQLLLTNLISDQSNVQAGILYNGDATDAYFSSDNIESVIDGTIRFLRPKSNLLLIDGLVIAHSDNVKESEYDRVLETAKAAFLDGLQQNSWAHLSSEQVEALPAFENFNYVSYTPAFKVLYEYALNNIFNDLTPYEAEYAKQLYEIQPTYNIVDPVTNQVLFSYNVKHVGIVPTDQKTQTNLTTYWNQKTKK